MTEDRWHDLGPAEAFARQPVSEVAIGLRKLAITFRDGEFGAIDGQCNHAGGPLGQGRLDGDYVVCPWHHWKFHSRTGLGEPGYEGDAVPSYNVKVEGGRLWVNLAPATKRSRLPHPEHPVARPVERAPGPTRVAGISTTCMDRAHPRYSTSEALLKVAVERAAGRGCETQWIQLDRLQFRSCEGYYSKAAHACTWPCSITQMDKRDEMTVVYEALVHWADVVLLATPIRWGSASSLYFKMAERLNCVQNQITIADRVLIRNKVAAFVIVGGQDNIQGVAGSLLGFFAELGFVFPPFPYIAHSRGWSAEDMENNVEFVRGSKELREASEALSDRAVELSQILLAHVQARERIERGGRKAHRNDGLSAVAGGAA
jgi:nitrite reductase/ring-hydroxylating ferredoxin subunit/multimeric flavodoxin WrbA